MKLYLKERIGHPGLFTGRKKELDSLMKWVANIKPELSKSKAIISRRKTGKSALMERLFNLIFERNDKVVPFYFEIRETSQWIGEFAEYVVMNHLKHHACKQNDLYVSMINNLPEDFRFVEYDSIWSYAASPIHKKNIQIDVFARAPRTSKDEQNEPYSLIGEVKNRKAKFSLKEAKEFLDKAKQVKKMEDINKALFFVFSASGFYKNALKFLADNKIAISEDKKLFDT